MAEQVIKKNEHYIMSIDDIGINGEGIGKVNGFTLFVKGALPGEEIEVRVVKVKKHFGFGKLIKIIKPSLDRVEPKCEIANRCGGCQLQHLSYEGQLRFKTKKVKDIMERIGGFDSINVLPTIGMENPFYYRNKVQLPVRKKDGDLKIGFFAPKSHNILNLDHCYIQHGVNHEILDAIKSYITDCNVSVYDEIKHKGLIRHIVTRVGFHTNEVMVCLVINGHKLPSKDVLIKRLRAIGNVESISVNINTQKTNVILGNETKVLWGKRTIVDYIGPMKFEISPVSFFQVNPVQTKVLYEKALDFADLNGDEIVWDAYCGIGSISLFLAQKAKKVYGVEIVEQAVKDAIHNAEINDMDNVEFFVGKAEEVIPDMYEKKGIKADVMVVDPPRKGCDQQLLDTMIKMEPKRIVYVSCDPATLARDLKYLAENGYEPEVVQPVDMFPMTGHVETVVKLEKK